jgi:hypothetical protein
MLYQETQKLYVKETMLFLAILYIILFILYAIQGAQSWRSGYMSPSLLPFYPAAFLIVLFIISRYKVETSVTYDSLTIKYAWRKRTIPLSNIVAVDVERFRMRKWRGYVRYRGSWCYISNAADKGLWITLKKGKPFMVSSATPEEFARALNKVIRPERFDIDREGMDHGGPYERYGAV